MQTQKTQHQNVSRVARVITFLMGEEFKKKIHYLTVVTQERIINPSKKKKTMRERERELTYTGVGNMDWMRDNNLFLVKKMG